MNLEAFLHHLHFDIDSLYPADWEVDWEDAPLTYKLYRGLPVVPLSPEVPLVLEGVKAPLKPDLTQIGHFLWYVYGLSQVNQSAFAADASEPETGIQQSYRRFAPSGGGLYPNELYIYLRVDDLPTGVYHYDVAHHRLVLIREGNFDDYLTQVLGNRCDLSACFGVAFISTMFWKNFYKYNGFAHRLQGLDAGVLMGQLLETAKRFRFTTGVHFQFLDVAINHLLGLLEGEEIVYAVIPLSVEPADAWFGAENAGHAIVSAADLCREVEAVHHHHFVKSRKLLDYPTLLRINEVSRLETTESFRRMGNRKRVRCEGEAVVLPAVSLLAYDLAAVCRKRWSPGTDFLSRRMSEEQLATLFHNATESFKYRNDVDDVHGNPLPRVNLYACLSGFETIPDGAYHYDGSAHVLRQLCPGDHRYRLQQGMSMHNVNLFQVPVCVHVAGDRDHLLPEFGYRGYRIQQMEAGMLVQRVLLTACAIGLGGHPLLGFDSTDCDEIYRMGPIEQTSLIQIPVGSVHPASRLEGSVHG